MSLNIDEKGNIYIYSGDSGEIVVSGLPTDKNYTFSDQIEAKLTYYLGLSESYKNFKINLSKGQPQAIKLNSEFENFKDAKGRQTEEEGMYRLLSTLNRNEDFTKWKNVSDQTLMEDIRKNIETDTLEEFRDDFYKKYYNK